LAGGGGGGGGTGGALVVHGSVLSRIAAWHLANDKEFARIWRELDQYGGRFVVISAEMVPNHPATAREYTGYAFQNPLKVPILFPEYLSLWDPAAAGGAFVNPFHPQAGQVLGHELVHLLGIVRTGRLFLDGEPVPEFRFFPEVRP
jgi:hypothetical protein